MNNNHNDNVISMADFLGKKNTAALLRQLKSDYAWDCVYDEARDVLNNGGSVREALDCVNNHIKEISKHNIKTIVRDFVNFCHYYKAEIK